MISVSVAIPAPRWAVSAALAPDLVELRVLERLGGVGEVLVEPAPERACPRADVGPALPEELQGRFVERAGSLIGSHGLRNALPLIEGLQQVLGDFVHGSLLRAKSSPDATRVARFGTG